MTDASVAILIPAMRPQNLQPLITSIADSTEDYSVTIVATGECADVARKLKGPITVIDDGGGTYPIRINRAFSESTEPYVVLGADDLRFHGGWFNAAFRHMKTIDGVVGLNDLYNMSGVHFMVSRDYVNDFGGVVDEPGVVLCPLYAHQYCDDEIRHTAQFRERWAFAHDAIVEHLHPGAGKAQSDETYAAGESSGAHDREIFLSRRHLWGQ